MIKQQIINYKLIGVSEFDKDTVEIERKEDQVRE